MAGRLIKSLGRVSGLTNFGDLSEWRATTSAMQARGRDFKGELTSGEKSISEICKEINDTRVSQQRTGREVAENTAVSALATEEGQEVVAKAFQAGFSSALEGVTATVSSAMKGVKGKGQAFLKSFGRNGTEENENGESSSSSSSSSNEPTNMYGNPFSSLNTRKQRYIKRNRNGNPKLRQRELALQQYRNLGVRPIKSSQVKFIPIENTAYGLHTGQFYLPKKAFYQLHPEVIPETVEGGRRQTRRRNARKSKKTRKHA